MQQKLIRLLSKTKRNISVFTPVGFRPSWVNTKKLFILSNDVLVRGRKFCPRFNLN